MKNMNLRSLMGLKFILARKHLASLQKMGRLQGGGKTTDRNDSKYSRGPIENIRKNISDKLK